eukprot:COSAG04_NODE_2914_length_3390_cov_5.396536_3_plen_44_part_00
MVPSAQEPPPALEAIFRSKADLEISHVHSAPLPLIIQVPALVA